MLAEVLGKEAHRAYRRRLETLLGIPLEASDLEIHTLIAAGFPARSIKHHQ